MAVATFDIGGTAIKYCLMDGEGMRCQGEVPTPDTTATDPEEFLQVLEGIIGDFKAQGEVEGMAFSMPGIIDVDAKTIALGGQLEYLYNTDLKPWEDRFGMSLEVENDARCGAVAELAAGSLKGVQTGAVLTFGTGIGGCIIVNGELHKGANLYAGEASMVYNGWPDKTTGMVDPATFTADCSTTALCKNVAHAKGIEACTGRDVFAWIEDGDEVAAGVLRKLAEGVAMQIHNLQCWLDPERIAIGGGVSRNPRFVEAIVDAHRRFNADMYFDFPEVEIVACQYFNDANLVGAYHNYLRRRAC